MLLNKSQSSVQMEKPQHKINVSICLSDVYKYFGKFNIYFLDRLIWV